jgi:hypothetical protein
MAVMGKRYLLADSNPLLNVSARGNKISLVPRIVACGVSGRERVLQLWLAGWEQQPATGRLGLYARPMARTARAGNAADTNAEEA